MQPLTELVRTLAAALTAASVVGYACGYLALRARAFALGTDPAFQLVDQIYVFAGVRFLATTLAVGLVLAPVILLLRWAARRLARALAGPAAAALQWISLAALVVATLAFLAILTADGVLLRDATVLTPLERAVVGLPGAEGLRVALFLVPTLLASLAALWLATRLQSGVGPLGAVLAAVMALQLFMLPLLHGALFADRRARVLADVPEGAAGLVAPVAIVDRTAERATLFGRDAEGRPRLATVAIAQLDGISVEAVVPLGALVAPTATPVRHIADIPAGGWVLVADAADGSAAPAADAGVDLSAGVYDTLVGYFGMVLESLGSLGGGPDSPGALWAVDFDATGRPGEARQIGALADLAWPVTAPGGGFAALQGDRVLRLDADGSVVEVLGEGGTWRKLIGVAPDGSVLGLLRRDGATVLARMAPDGSLAFGPATTTDARLARLTQDARGYTGGLVLIVERSARGGRGFDIFLRTPSGALRLSDCGDDHCGQPSLAPDRRRAVFIRAPRP